jgi:hypothetical protein
LGTVETLYFGKTDGSMEKESKTAPAVYTMITTKIINKRKFNEAMFNMRWISYFQGALTFLVLFKYIELYQLLDQVELQPPISRGSLPQASSLPS